MKAEPYEKSNCVINVIGPWAIQSISTKILISERSPVTWFVSSKDWVVPEIIFKSSNSLFISDTFTIENSEL